MRTPSILLAVILFCCCQLALVSQPSIVPMPTFLGTVKGSDGKVLSIESDDGNTMQFTCTRKTEFLDGKKRIKATDLQPGEYVSVEAKKAPDRTLDAVIVHREKRPDA
ncbi:hypothetical protein [Paludibaculum fermentans]|uniref:DUF5666 domain-containing protein n=1 Tax=Paludibaculum fermentans TaxID=1473598 RepID=A0A7S7NKT1_PALFE|nr:hypothetical protein [Paludibaculum fermentans]QOY85488.1 hypothetical protein IRI77_21965 [Paludibaculum fermentans]